MHTPTHTTTAGIRFTALDLGLEAPCAGAVRVSLEAFGVVQRGRIIGTDQLDGDGVLVINETFILELAEGSSLRSEVLDALLSTPYPCRPLTRRTFSVCWRWVELAELPQPPPYLLGGGLVSGAPFGAPFLPLIDARMLRMSDLCVCPRRVDAVLRSQVLTVELYR